MTVTYRVEIKPTHIHCVPFDRLNLQVSQGEKRYPNLESMPKWMQEKMSVLNMLSMKPSQDPNARSISGVGKRISKRVFWLEGGE